MNAREELEGIVYGKRSVAIGATLKTALEHCKKLGCGEHWAKGGILERIQKRVIRGTPLPKKSDCLERECIFLRGD